MKALIIALLISSVFAQRIYENVYPSSYPPQSSIDQHMPQQRITQPMSITQQQGNAQNYINQKVMPQAQESCTNGNSYQPQSLDLISILGSISIYYQQLFRSDQYAFGALFGFFAVLWISVPCIMIFFCQQKNKKRQNLKNRMKEMQMMFAHSQGMNCFEMLKQPRFPKTIHV